MSTLDFQISKAEKEVDRLKQRIKGLKRSRSAIPCFLDRSVDIAKERLRHLGSLKEPKPSISFSTRANLGSNIGYVVLSHDGTRWSGHLLHNAEVVTFGPELDTVLEALSDPLYLH